MAINPTEDHIAKTVTEHQPRLRSFIARQVTNKSDAEDILQDVLYQFVKSTQTPLEPIEHISSWLFRVARNTIINAGKKKKEYALPERTGNDGETYVPEDFSELLLGEDTAPDPETEYLRSLVWEELENTLAELPPEQREIFELTELEGIPVKDIAEAMEVSVNTVLSRKRYAVMHLRKRLATLYNDIIKS